MDLLRTSLRIGLALRPGEVREKGVEWRQAASPAPSMAPSPAPSQLSAPSPCPSPQLGRHLAPLHAEAYTWT